MPKGKLFQIHIDDGTSRLVSNNRKALPEILAKAYNLSTKGNSFLDVAEVGKGSADGHENPFSLHRGLVPEDQLDHPNELVAIGILLDITRALTLCIKRNLELRVSSGTAVEKRGRNA